MSENKQLVELSEQERTFLELKWGGQFLPQILKAWYEDDTVHFTSLEKNIIFEWHKKLAGVTKE